MQIVDRELGPLPCATCGETDSWTWQAVPRGWDARDFQAHMGRARARCSCANHVAVHTANLTPEARGTAFAADAIV